MATDVVRFDNTNSAADCCYKITDKANRTLVIETRRSGSPLRSVEIARSKVVQITSGQLC